MCDGGVVRPAVVEILYCVLLCDVEQLVDVVSILT